MKKQLEDFIFESIFEAVSDGRGREWTDEEKALILSNPSLLKQLQCWLENSLSDSCWHQANCELVRSSSKSSALKFTDSIEEEEEIHIPF